MLPSLSQKSVGFLKNQSTVFIPVSGDAEEPGCEVVKEAKTELYTGYGFNYPLLLISLIAKRIFKKEAAHIVKTCLHCKRLSAHVSLK